MADRPIVANLDFESIKSDLINHFKSRSEFADYEFTGSALNLLLDILSYNTHYYSLASNFLLNESYLDTSLIRQNVVSIAKRLNYTPRSVRSASTTITLGVTKQNSFDSYVIIPAGTVFTSSAGNQTITFYTIEDNIVQFSDLDAVGTEKTVDVVIYEGTYRTQRIISDTTYDEFAHFDLGQNDIDTTSINIAINGNKWSKVTPEDETLFDLTSESNVYFIEENRDGNPSVVFGDGIAGRALQQGDEILISYLTSNGEDGNGIKNFTVSVYGRPDARITTTPTITQGGGDQETIQSIKDNAPKWFQAQYRAVTANDYQTIIRNKFADIQSISVYGGEEVGQPGKVFVCIKPKSADTLSTSTKEIIKSEIISSSNVVTVRPQLVDPQILKIVLKTVVVYDESRLSTSTGILKAKVQTLYDYMNTEYVGDFLSSFRESNFSYELKDLDKSIVSSNTRVTLKVNIGYTKSSLDKYSYSLNNKLYHPVDGFKATSGGILSSSLFYRAGNSNPSGFDEDGYGNIRLYDWIDNTKVYVNNNAGRIDYDNGDIQFLYDVTFDSAGTFSVSVVPESVDVIAKNDVILEVDSGDSTVDVVEIEETDLLKSINLNRSF